MFVFVTLLCSYAVVNVRLCSRLKRQPNHNTTSFYLCQQFFCIFFNFFYKFIFDIYPQVLLVFSSFCWDFLLSTIWRVCQIVFKRFINFFIHNFNHFLQQKPPIYYIERGLPFLRKICKIKLRFCTEFSYIIYRQIFTAYSAFFEAAFSLSKITSGKAIPPTIFPKMLIKIYPITLNDASP